MLEDQLILLVKEEMVVEVVVYLVVLIVLVLILMVLPILVVEKIILHNFPEDLLILFLQPVRVEVEY